MLEQSTISSKSFSVFVSKFPSIGVKKLYSTSCIQICILKSVFSLWNSLYDVIYSKSTVFSLKHVQYS